ncbi:hypothetical protein TNCV_1818391 [Trichonephila clavipes]|nr:hypothetical protein TNCV_1818391 [Trichonephila clavipes]
MHTHKHSSNVHSPKAEFTPRLSASSVERLANQRLRLGRDEVSDWLDAQRWQPWCECCLTVLLFFTVLTNIPHSSTHYDRRLTHIIRYLQFD